MESNEKKTVRKILDDADSKILGSIAGGKKDDEGGICRFCGQTYTGAWDKHMTKECPANGK